MVSESAHFMELRCDNSPQLEIHLRQASGGLRPGNAVSPKRHSWKSKGFDLRQVQVLRCRHAERISGNFGSHLVPLVHGFSRRGMVYVRGRREL